MAIYRIPELKLPLDHAEGDIRQRVARELNVPPEAVLSWRVERKSVDARDRSAIKIVYGVAATLSGTSNARRYPALAFPPAPLGGSYAFPESRREPAGRPIIVGAGPAGLFCALLLAERGLKPLVLERGGDVDSRISSIDRFWKTGRLDPDSNMQFGEGGAGTFSDGKLNTTVNDPSGRNGKVLAEFIAAGAPGEIAYSNKPHIGTDYLVGVVRNLRGRIEALGGEVRFSAKVTSLVVEGGRAVGVVVGGSESIAAGAVVLAVGHSARDVFESLARGGVPMEPKAFAIGVRIEHPQEIDRHEPSRSILDHRRGERHEPPARRDRRLARRQDHALRAGRDHDAVGARVFTHCEAEEARQHVKRHEVGGPRPAGDGQGARAIGGNDLVRKWLLRDRARPHEPGYGNQYSNERECHSARQQVSIITSALSPPGP